MNLCRILWRRIRGTSISFSKTVLCIGRWQPLHEGHLALLQTVFDEGAFALIGIRVGKRNKDNPYSYRQRKRMIKKALRGKPYKVVKLPDRDYNFEVRIGRKVGYTVKIFPEDAERPSGTEIREALRKGGEL